MDSHLISSHYRGALASILSVTALLFLSLVLSVTPALAETRTAQSILHTLDYVSVDYPEVVQNGVILDAAEYEEQQEFTQRLLPLIAKLPNHEAKPALKQRTLSLIDAVNQRRDGETVRGMCAELSAQIISSYRIVTAPRQPASIELGAQLFESNCTGCHGMNGYGDGPAAATMSPAPSNFHDRQRQGLRSPYSLYTTITLGVDGTAMQSYAHLSEAERWSLSFYLSTLFHTAEEQQTGQQLWTDGKGHEFVGDLKELSRLTPDEIQRHHGSEGLAVLAHLRQQPAILDSGAPASPLMISRIKLEDSLAAYRANRSQEAYELAVNAYLEGFELAEAAIANVAPEMKQQIERAMGDYRQQVKQQAPLQQVNQQGEHVLSLLQQAEDKLASTELSSGVAFVSALVILLREGLEAILVLAAIAAFLIKTERRDAMPYMHAGWIGALLLGIVTWLLAEFAFDFSGASRELTEGITGLFAAAMLVYIGFWLHNHTHAERWKAFIHSKLHGVTSGTVWSLAIISFVAVYREVVETVLFYKTLWMQTEVAGHSAIIGGFASAALALVVIALAIFRFSVRLPLSLFFRINAALLYTMAVIFAGNGIAALQEAGHVTIHNISMPQIDLLGIYPTLESFGLQLALVLLAVSWLSVEKIKKRRLEPVEV